jgi:chitinase
MIIYDFTIPYSGGGQLTITNTGTSSESINGLHFTTNLVAGTPYGDLYPYQAALHSTPQPEGEIDYVLVLAQPLSIAPQQTRTLNLPYSKVNGVLPIAMDPSSVNIVQGKTVTPLALKGTCQGDACNDPVPNYSMRGYFANWDIYARKFTINKMPIDKLNEIIYAFVNYNTQGNIKLIDPNSDDKMLVELSKLRRKYPYLKTKLSIGGWTLSGNFSPMTANPSALKNFINQVVKAVEQLNLSGVDIDWEYPVTRQGAAGDATRYADLLCGLQTGLQQLSKKTGETYGVSIAAPGGVDKIQAIQNDDPNAWQRIIDCGVDINVMTYDYHGAFDKISDNQSPMQSDPRDPNAQTQPGKDYAVMPTIKAYLALGVPSRQLTVGIPLYGRAMLVDSTKENYGLWRPITGSPPGQFNDKTGMYDYQCVRYNNCGSGTGFTDMQFLPAMTSPLTNVTQVPWGYSPSTNAVISLDDIDSTTNKAKMVVSEKLGGAMFWLPSGDANAADKSLISAAQNVFTTQAEMAPQIALAAVAAHATRHVTAGVLALVKWAFSGNVTSQHNNITDTAAHIQHQLVERKKLLNMDANQDLEKKWKLCERGLMRVRGSHKNTPRTQSVLNRSKALLIQMNERIKQQKRKNFHQCLKQTDHSGSRFFSKHAHCFYQTAQATKAVAVGLSANA